MKTKPRTSGFSLIEVNMAVFVMAIGVLSMVVLYPLGLRESRQGQDDLQQAMLADSVLNQLVADLSRTNMSWSAWKAVNSYVKGADDFGRGKPEFEAINFSGALFQTVPQNVLRGDSDIVKGNPHLKHKVYCHRVPDASGKIMGLQVEFVRRIGGRDKTVQSYYAEAMFQGKP